MTDAGGWPREVACFLAPETGTVGLSLRRYTRHEGGGPMTCSAGWHQARVPIVEEVSALRPLRDRYEAEVAAEADELAARLAVPEKSPASSPPKPEPSACRSAATPATKAAAP